MKRTLRYATDLHLFGPSSMEHDVDRILACHVMLGDIFDLKNCKKQDVKKVQLFILDTEKRLGNRFISGNHELIKRHDVYVIQKTCFVHGDFEAWGHEKALEFRSQEPASGFRFTKKYWDMFRHLVQGRLNTEQLERCYETATKHNCQMLVMGHSHVKRQIRYNYKGIIVVQLPRGFGEIEII